MVYTLNRTILMAISIDDWIARVQIDLEISGSTNNIVLMDDSARHYITISRAGDL